MGAEVLRLTVEEDAVHVTLRGVSMLLPFAGFKCSVGSNLNPGAWLDTPKVRLERRCVSGRTGDFNEFHQNLPEAPMDQKKVLGVGGLPIWPAERLQNL